jgi:hypothetical protein
MSAFDNMTEAYDWLGRKERIETGGDVKGR